MVEFQNTMRNLVPLVGIRHNLNITANVIRVLLQRITGLPISCVKSTLFAS